MASSERYIGLMSGTSMDAVDAVLLSVKVASGACTVEAHCSIPIAEDLKREIHFLSHPGQDCIDRLGQTDTALGALFAQTCLSLLQQQNLLPTQITAIGSHGQTIRHQPPSLKTQHAFTVQIGDPNTIAAITGITTVADFRRKDVALGGEGAPLVPAFHQAVFHADELSRAVVNIGGIANITWLPAISSGQPVTGFDTGPGNCLMDAWTQRHLQQPFDDRGKWAFSGTVIPELLDRLLTEPFLSSPPPKSTGKELFNLQWLELELQSLGGSYAPADVQATLCSFTAQTIAQGIRHASNVQLDEIYMCGGGAFNDHLLACLKDCLPQIPIQSTAAVGIHPLHVEGAAFAWLAQRTLKHLAGNLPEVTGAQRPAILGGIYLP